jgi:hypothetical protein
MMHPGSQTPRSGGFFAALAFASAVIVASAGLIEAVGPGAPSEYQVKAAFLYNFAKFVEWPARAFPSPSAPFTFCIVGADPFGQDLEQTINNETVGGREIAIRRLKRVEREPCHIVFISASERETVPQILAILKSSSALTVSEFDSFIRIGGMVNLYMEDDRIRFEISIMPAENAGLRISSKLLKLAKLAR